MKPSGRPKDWEILVGAAAGVSRNFVFLKMHNMEFLIDGYRLIIDAEDEHLLARYTWRALVDRGGKVYFRRKSRAGGKSRSFFLHRTIVNASKGVIVDHHDGDTLNCRRSNLRLGDSILNARNAIKIRNRQTTSRFKGVHYRKRERKWKAVIRYDGKQRELGYFSNEVEAAFSYDIASMKYHGDHGRTNFLPLVR